MSSNAVVVAAGKTLRSADDATRLAVSVCIWHVMKISYLVVSIDVEVHEGRHWRL